MATENKKKTGTKSKQTKTTGAKPRTTSNAKKTNNEKVVKTNTVKTTSQAKAKTKTTNSNTTQSSKKTSVKSTTTNKKRNEQTSKKNTAVPKKKTTSTKQKKEIVQLPKDVEEIKVEQENTVQTEKVQVKPQTLEVQSFLGEVLPLEATQEAKRRRKKSYIKDAAFFGAVVSILDLFAMIFIKGYPKLFTNLHWFSYAIVMLIEFVLVFIFTYLIDYLIVEKSVKQNN